MRRSHFNTIFNKNISVIKYKYIYNGDKYKTCKNKTNKKVLKHKKYSPCTMKIMYLYIKLTIKYIFYLIEYIILFDLH